jgi:rhodanese-related sulfurtransferase
MKILSYNHKKIIKDSFYILIISMISGFLCNNFSTNQIPYIYVPYVIESGSFVSLAEAKNIYDKKQAVFIDSRKESDFNDGHIKGSLNIPASIARMYKIKRLQDISKETNIIIYCYNVDCRSAERLAGELNFLGYKHTAVFPAGWDAWLKAQYPIGKN